MSVGIEALFTSALGLQAPWSVQDVALDTSRRRIDFNLTCNASRLPCPHCAALDQGVHDRLTREWRHLDFFQFEAWLHAEVPRVACSACGKTGQIDVPWAREGSGFTALFEALALSLCKELPVRQAAALLLFPAIPKQPPCRRAGAMTSLAYSARVYRYSSSVSWGVRPTSPIYRTD